MADIIDWIDNGFMRYTPSTWLDGSYMAILTWDGGRHYANESDLPCISRISETSTGDDRKRYTWEHPLCLYYGDWVTNDFASVSIQAETHYAIRVELSEKPEQYIASTWPDGSYMAVLTWDGGKHYVNESDLPCISRISETSTGDARKQYTWKYPLCCHYGTWVTDGVAAVTIQGETHYALTVELSSRPERR